MVYRKPRPSHDAAYTLVDLSDLNAEDRKAIIQDANEGGGLYGVRIVEEAINGPARAPIYGVYNAGPDADRWAEAKKDLGISGSEVDDAQVYAGAGAEVTDPRRAAALREAAAQRVEGEADRIRAGEDSAIAEIVGEDAEATRDSSARRPTGGDHPQNIVDTSLAADAENEASEAEPAEPAAPPTRRNRAPR